jgi:hypothetical protein
MTKFLNSKQAQEEEAAEAQAKVDEKMAEVMRQNLALQDRLAAMEETLTKAYMMIMHLQVENSALKRDAERMRMAIALNEEGDDAANGG